MKAFYPIIILIFISRTAYTQWGTNPNENLQMAVHGGNIHTTTDGNGGVIITFNNFDYVENTTYLQWADKYGFLKWSTPKIIADGPGPKNYPVDIFLTNDGSVLISYISGYDSISGLAIYYRYNSYVHKLDKEGNKLWGEYGISVKGDTTGRNLGIYYCYDGNGGVFAFYRIGYELTYPPYYLDSLFIQHISNDGERLWGKNGIFIGDTILHTNAPWIVNNDSGGIFIHYRKQSNEYNISKYDSTGNLNWTLINPINFSGVIKDGQGGIIISGVVNSYPAKKIIINRISSEGEKLWGEDGIIVDDSVDNSPPALLFLNCDSTVSVFWSTEWYPPTDDLLLQRYTLDGEQVWEEHVKVSEYISPKIEAGIIKSENNLNIVVWGETRDSSALYAQKIDALGNKLWDDDKLIGSKTSEPSVLTDGNDGAIIVWRKGTPWGGIYAQQISKNGNLGEVITSVKEDNNNIKPGSFYLSQNYPNPFNPNTVISYQLAVGSQVTLKVYDVLGREVATLVNEEKPAGNYEVTFDVGVSRRFALSSGIYFYRIETGKNTSAKKMILLK